jgi:hypothetical protein
MDLARVVVVAPEKLSGPERKALALLTDEVHRRTLVRFERQDDPPAERPRRRRRRRLVSRLASVGAP